jgi:hypothetical protein
VFNLLYKYKSTNTDAKRRRQELQRAHIAEQVRAQLLLEEEEQELRREEEEEEEQLQQYLQRKRNVFFSDPAPPPNAAAAGESDDIAPGAAAYGLVENKGTQLLRKMGWADGQGLGANASGAVAPVTVMLHAERAGTCMRVTRLVG